MANFLFLKTVSQLTWGILFHISTLGSRALPLRLPKLHWNQGWSTPHSRQLLSPLSHLLSPHFYVNIIIMCYYWHLKIFFQLPAPMGNIECPYKYDTKTQSDPWCSSSFQMKLSSHIIACWTCKYWACHSSHTNLFFFYIIILYVWVFCSHVWMGTWCVHCL